MHWLLKYACRSSFSWTVTGGHSIDHSCLTPEALQKLEQQGAMHRERSVPWHYYQNVVTPRSAPEQPRLDFLADAYCACGVECCDISASSFELAAFTWRLHLAHQACMRHNRQ